MSEIVQKMFADIAPRYDLTNTVLSFGIHHRWRKRAVKESGAKAGMSVLDCATGTGDLAIEFKKTVGEKGAVLGTDFCAEMLSFAPEKAKKIGIKVGFEVADAMNLPYADASFDISSISFGIRNVDSPVQALGEMARVLRSGGKVAVLEFGQPDGFFGAMYRFHSRFAIPAIGGLLTGNREAYSYLPRTAAKFPCKNDFLDLMRQTNRFSDCRYIPLTFGVAFLYIGTVK